MNSNRMTLLLRDNYEFDRGQKSEIKWPLFEEKKTMPICAIIKWTRRIRILSVLANKCSGQLFKFEERELRARAETMNSKLSFATLIALFVITFVSGNLVNFEKAFLWFNKKKQYRIQAMTLSASSAAIRYQLKRHHTRYHCNCWNTAVGQHIFAADP